MTVHENGTMPSESAPAARQIAGVPLDYLKKRRRRLPKRTPGLTEYIDQWIAQRRSAIHDVRERGTRAKQGQLDALSLSMIQRWQVLQIGRSPKAWMERSMTLTAMLLDFRSRRFGRRVHAQKDNWEKHTLDFSLGSQEDSSESFRAPSAAEYHQAHSALVFAREYQRYLNTLLIRPPGHSPDERVTFPSFWSEPDVEVKRVIADLAHCRPAGAFFSDDLNDRWSLLGGREECRKPMHCPHCHARYFSRLVERILNGPWTTMRRRGRRIVFARLSVPSSELGLSREVQAVQRHELGLNSWLRRSTERYDADPGDETMIRNVDCGQDLATSLTPHEVQTARRLQHELVQRCTRHGLSGGIRFHAIGPRKKTYLHELSVVGEVAEQDIGQFSRAFGIDGPVPEIERIPIECVVFPPGYAESARVAIAGTSWQFDLDQIGAVQNPFLRSHTCWPRRGPVGLRGACAWQPLFLLSSVAFWSRWKVLKDIRFKSHEAFGEWTSLLESDRNHKSTVQKARQKINGDISHSPVRRLQRRIENSGVSQASLAELVGVSRTAVNRFVKNGHGSELLRQRLAEALMTISRPESCRFVNANTVKSWLSEVSHTQSWLAETLGYSPSKVSRLLGGKISWNVSFGIQVEELAERLAATRDCRTVTPAQTAQTPVQSSVE